MVLVTNEVHRPLCHASFHCITTLIPWSGWPELNRRSPRWRRSVLPLDYSRSSSGSGRGIRTQTVRGVKDRYPAIRRSRSILLSTL